MPQGHSPCAPALHPLVFWDTCVVIAVWTGSGATCSAVCSCVISSHHGGGSSVDDSPAQETMWQALGLLLLANPVLSWVTWYGSTQHDDVSNYVTATTRDDETKVSNHQHNNTTIISGAVDILRLLNVSDATPGVSLVAGPAPEMPAFKLRPSYGLVQVPSPAAITAALSSSAGFTLVFIYRQHRKSLGTLLSVHSPGRVSPWFQLTSNLRTGQLVLHYRLSTDTKLHQNSWPLLPPHAERVNAVLPEPRRGGLGWTHVSLSLNTSSHLLRLHTDCQAGREQPLAGSWPQSRLHIPEDALVYFRQEPGFKKKFLGSMQVARILPYAARAHPDWSCHGEGAAPEPLPRRLSRQPPV